MDKNVKNVLITVGIVILVIVCGLAIYAVGERITRGNKLVEVEVISIIEDKSNYFDHIIVERVDTRERQHISGSTLGKVGDKFTTKYRNLN